MSQEQEEEPRCDVGIGVELESIGEEHQGEEML